jgi:hypothetical protein
MYIALPREVTPPPPSPSPLRYVIDFL